MHDLDRPTKYYLDTEFYESGHQNPIRLISIGLVCEDGRELYLENSEFDWSIVPADHWIQENVRPSLLRTQGKARTYQVIHDTTSGITDGYMSRNEMAKAIMGFVLCRPNPVFYGYFADYDWVVFCQLFGRMVDLPSGFPYYCRDLKQLMDGQGRTKEWKDAFCPDPEGEHNALVDARWNMKLHKALMEL